MSTRQRKTLKHMSPDEKREHVRHREREKKRRQRAGPNQEKERMKRNPLMASQAAVNRPRAKLSPELNEFVDELLTMSLGPAALALAMWQREYKQWLRLDPPEYPTNGTATDFPAYTAARERHRKFGLIVLMAGDAIKRHQNKESARRRALMRATHRRERIQASADPVAAEKRLSLVEDATKRYSKFKKCGARLWRTASSPAGEQLVDAKTQAGTGALLEALLETGKLETHCSGRW